ncbi:DUF2500 domain-containing protein [Enterococcus sp. LJL98]
MVETVSDPFSSSSFFFFPSMIFVLIFLIILGVVCYRLLEAMRNANASEEVVRATLIDKNNETSYTTHSEGMHSGSTRYTLTFEFENKERKSFDVSRKVFLLYVVGDTGRLAFQRKRFNRFERE